MAYTTVVVRTPIPINNTIAPYIGLTQAGDLTRIANVENESPDRSFLVINRWYAKLPIDGYR